MAENWRILDLTFFRGEISFDKKVKRLVVADVETGEATEHVLQDINVVFIGVGVKLAPALLYYLSKHDVVVLACDWKGVPAASMYPWIDAHGRVAARQRAQAALSAPRSKDAWKRVVKAKIRGQANNLDCLNLDGGNYLRQIASSVKSGDPENREAQAAKAYWKFLFGDKAFSRTPGIQNDQRNALLDYGYTVLRGHSMRAVLSAGLTPALGVFHHGRSNAFALADDFIEPFRPAVDYAVWHLNEEGKTTDEKETRKTLLQSTLGDFGCDERSVSTVMTDFSQQYGQYVEGDRKVLEVPVWNMGKE